MRSLTSVDLFSGAGGLTEGFHQSGFKVLASLDNWRPAAETHAKNFPGTEMFHADILTFDPADLPPVDVLVGSPPCTEFSYANRGGHGDLDLGMRFVLRFLRFVHDLAPRYWAMENVPRLAQSLPSRIPLRRLGLRKAGSLDIPVRRVLNSADFGAPQKRLRLFSGRFPVPEPTHHSPIGTDGDHRGPPWRTVQDVLDLLPDPLGRGRDGDVTDPNYGFEIPVGQLSDHFMDTRLSLEEVRINRRSKMDHSWYGRMAFPDPTDRPARTVMATQSGVSRETLVLEGASGGRRAYRRPTIRECATFQTFPITYQFWGRTAEVRYKLVGNAVPPVLAAAVARGIARDAGVPLPRTPRVSRSSPELPPIVSLAGRRRPSGTRRFPTGRKFRDHIPGSRGRGFRVDLDNSGTRRFGGPSSTRDPKGGRGRWTVRLYVGSGKNVTQVAPGWEDVVDQLAACAATSDLRERAERLALDLERRLVPFLGDATTLQGVWVGQIARPELGPGMVVSRLAQIVDRHFPPVRFEGVAGPVTLSLASIRRTEIPVRTAAYLFAGRYATEVIDRRSAGEGQGKSALPGSSAVRSRPGSRTSRAIASLPSARDALARAIAAR
jgi:DNA (cytosine-5)-methyltransferase 1